MERVTSDQMHRNLINNIHSAQRRLMQTQEEMSSGYTISKPSDDPVRSTQVMELMRQAKNIEQYQENLSYAQGWNQATEAAYNQGLEIAQRARTLLLQAANDSMSSQSRADIASEINNLVDSVKLLGNSKFGDEYIFAGTETEQAPYSLGAVDTYVGGSNQVGRLIGPSQTVTVGYPGSATWGYKVGTSNAGLIGALRNIADDLTTGTPASIASMRTAGLQRLDSEIENLSKYRSTAGELDHRIELQISRFSDLQLAGSELLSVARDTDLAKASAEFAQRTAALTAALKTGQQVVMPSLIDFMN